MIAYIEGKLVEKTPTYAVIDCGGVGYLIHISLNTFSKIKENGNCKLFTHLAIKEDAHTLYGFYEESERRIFRLLISVSGIGAGTARMILSSLNPDEIQIAIASGNVAALRKVKGIGEKSAQRIIVDLKDKMDKDTGLKEVSYSIHHSIKKEALSALVLLGFNKNLAENAIEKVSKTQDANSMKLEILIKEVLKIL
jgi:Holliday junction DNA helicase RuvA